MGVFYDHPQLTGLSHVYLRNLQKEKSMIGNFRSVAGFDPQNKELVSLDEPI